MPDMRELKSETAYFMALQEGENARVYLKDDVDAVLAAKDAEIARLKERKSPEDLNTLKARTTALLNDKEHPLSKEVRAVIEGWRDRSYRDYFLYSDVCEAYQELERRHRAVDNEGHAGVLEKLAVCVMAVFEKAFTLFRRA